MVREGTKWGFHPFQIVGRSTEAVGKEQKRRGEEKERKRHRDDIRLQKPSNLPWWPKAGSKHFARPEKKSKQKSRMAPTGSETLTITKYQEGESHRKDADEDKPTVLLKKIDGGEKPWGTKKKVANPEGRISQG